MIKRIFKTSNISCLLPLLNLVKSTNVYIHNYIRIFKKITIYVLILAIIIVCLPVNLSRFNQLLEVAKDFLHINGKLLVLSLLVKYLSFLLNLQETLIQTILHSQPKPKVFSTFSFSFWEFVSFFFLFSFFLHCINFHFSSKCVYFICIKFFFC